MSHVCAQCQCIVFSTYVTELLLEKLTGTPFPFADVVPYAKMERHMRSKIAQQAVIACVLRALSALATRTPRKGVPTFQTQDAFPAMASRVLMVNGSPNPARKPVL